MDSTCVMSYGTGLPLLTKSPQSMLVGRSFSLFEVLRRLFDLEFYVREKCVLRKIRVLRQEFEDQTEVDEHLVW